MKQTKIPKDIFKKYPGKQVAIVGGKVVAVSSVSSVSSDAFVAYNTAQKKYPTKKISLFSVPRKEDKCLIPLIYQYISG